MTTKLTRTRRRLLCAAAVVLGAGMLGVPPATGVSSDPCPTTATPTVVCLPNSTFESGDGNKTLDWTATSPAVERDWDAPGTGVHYLDTADKPSGTGDDSFGQGAKEDIPNPNIVSGSIPKNKSDLSDFFTAYETKTVGTANKTFLYLGWQRYNTLGNANMDFEFNQNPNQTYVNPTGTGTPTRTAGDILITFDFPGSGSPVLSMFKWTTTGSTSQCFSSNALPCWGQGTLGNLSAASVTEANAGVSSDGTFGEAGINLTDSGAFSTTGCTTFGDGLLKSRSSSSFTSEIKDFIQLPKNSISVSNCGSITFQKQDDQGTPAAVAGATFALYSDSAYTTPVTAGSTTLASAVTAAATTITVTDATKLPAGTGFDVIVGSEWMRVTGRSNNVLTVDRGVKADGLTATTAAAHSAGDAVTGVASCTTTGDTVVTGVGHVATCTIANLFFGDYYPVETTTPAGYQTVTDIPVVHLTATSSPVSVTYTDNRAPSTVKITKVDDAANPLGDAVFTLWNDVDNSDTLNTGDTTTAYTCTTKTAATATLQDPIGTCRITGIVTAGEYIVHETTTPAGYDAAPDQALTIALGTSYDLAALTGHSAFVDPHRYTVMVLVCRESDHTLYGSGVNLTPPTPGTSVTSPTTSLGASGPTEAQLCGAGGLASVTGTSVYPGKHAGSYNAAVTVPTAPPTP